jgi:hypothetical protein
MNLAAELAEEVTRKISRECEKWTKRCDDAKRIPDALFDFAPAMIREALVALAEREAWQPIASAPRDGTLILLHGHDQINPGYYDATPRIGGYGPWHWGITFQPTHWMRLPEPPTPKE